MNRLKISALAAVMTAALAGPSFALTPQEEAVFRQACTSDYMRLCSAYDPGSPQVDQCFKQNMKQLSPQCQSAITTYQKSNPGGTRR